MMKKITLLVLTCLLSILTNAQQLPQITQYMMNNYVVNPAVAGMDDYYQVRTSIRNQFVGIADAPSTTVLSMYGKKDENVGLGGVVFTDQAGPTSRVGASASYTYHFPLTKDVKLALALSGGFTQFKIDKAGWNVENTNDPLTQGDILVQSVPDATFGFNLYSKKWYVGFSIPQLLTSNLDLLDNDFADKLTSEQSGNLSRHLFVLAAYKHNLNKSWTIEPSILVKSVEPVEAQMDFGIKATYDDKLWFGTDYRTNGDIAALVGYSIQDRYMIGYSYDVLNADLSDYSNGSHEFMIAVKFNSQSSNSVK